jgi:selenium-binding protein 1
MVLEVRPAHNPKQTWGFVGVVISVADLSASIWLWHHEDDRWSAKKVITIPAEPAEESELPPALRPFGAVPPLISDIDLSVDDRWLYVSCWGTGELKQYDVSDPHNPVETGSVRLGGIVQRTPHPSAPGTPLSGGPQMVEISRDGRRVYFTNSLYAAWDEVFYPDGVGAWMAKVDADPVASSPTPRTSAASGSTRSACRAATPRATRTASSTRQDGAAERGRRRWLARTQGGRNI